MSSGPGDWCRRRRPLGGPGEARDLGKDSPDSVAPSRHSASPQAMNSRDVTYDMAEYDQYALCLSKALCYVATPVTVGLYAPWGSGMEHLQQKIERCVIKKAATIEQKEWKRISERPRSAQNWCGLFALVVRLLFFNPVLTQRQHDRRNVRFIFIPFNAWEFAGSDLLWAGLVTALCEGVRLHFRTLPTSIYRAICSRTVPKWRRGNGGASDWEAKRLLCVPLWFITIVFCLGLLAMLVIIIVLSFFYKADMVTTFEGVFASLLGISTAAALKVVVPIVRNVLVSQKAEVEKIMNKTNFSDQLGFMYKVRREVNIITNFVRYMEVFERRKIRVVLQLRNLDRCTPDKIVSVLEAMNILLSDKHARFVSLLGVDARVVAEAVARVYSNIGRASDSGYLLLNRTVDLPFTVPEMDKRMKLKFMNAFVEGMDWVINDDDDAALPTTVLRSVTFGEQRPSARDLDNSAIPLLVHTMPVEGQGMSSGPVKAGQVVQETLNILKRGEGDILDYVEDNLVKMRRIVNTLPVIVRLVVAKHGGLGPSLTPQKLVAWTVLSTQWPCRLSWILQCSSAERNSLPLGRCSTQGPVEREDTSLWDVYERSLKEFRALMKDLDNFFILDGDSTRFETFLKQDHVFTVQEGTMLRPLTVNLDRSIQSQMELLRGKYSIRNFDRKQGGRGEVVAASELLNMTPEDVCIEMEALNLERLVDYQARAVEHGVSGHTLLHGTEEEIRKALGIELLGDWALFRGRFLGTPQISRVARDTVDGGGDEDETCGERDEEEETPARLFVAASGTHRRYNHSSDASSHRV